MKLRAYRIKLGMSQQMVAESLGVDQSSVSRYEDGLIPSFDIMRRIDEWSGGRVGPLDFYDFWRGPNV